MCTRIIVHSDVHVEEVPEDMTREEAEELARHALSCAEDQRMGNPETRYMGRYPWERLP